MKNLSPILFTLLFTAAMQGMDTKSTAAATQAAAVFFRAAQANKISLGKYKSGSEITLASEGLKINQVEMYKLNSSATSKLAFTFDLTEQSDFKTHRDALEYYRTHHATGTVAVGALVSFCAFWCYVVISDNPKYLSYAALPFLAGCAGGTGWGLYKYSTTPKEAFEYWDVISRSSYPASRDLHIRTVIYPAKIGLLTHEAEGNHPVLVNTYNGTKEQLFRNLNDAGIE